MKKSIMYSAVISCFVLSATLVHAEGDKCDSPMHNRLHVSQQGTLFNNADTDGDGSISRAEFDAYNARQDAKHFPEMDTNKDGKITPDEMQGRHKQEMGSNTGLTHLNKRFDAADTNRDGVLSREEAGAMPMLKAYFDKVDANKNGKVTYQEYLDAMPLLHRVKDIDMSGKSQML